MSFQFVYDRNCPRLAQAQSVLAAADILLHEQICLDDLSPGDPLRAYASPTLLFRGQLVFGANTELPDVEELRLRISVLLL